jgi:hypothetical protein
VLVGLDVQLREVRPASVAREMNLISAALTVVRKEWRLIVTSAMVKSGHLRDVPLSREVVRLL